MNTMNGQSIPSKNLSHEPCDVSFESAKQVLMDKILDRGDLPFISVNKQLDLIEQSSQFALGRFLIERAGLNGYWTHYIVSYPEKGRSIENNSLENFLLNRAPVCLATQQRFAIFKQQIQKRIQENCSFASIPCGLMGDLLDLDYSGISDFSLEGIDLDPETLIQAADYAKEKGLLHSCSFSQQNAWELSGNASFDLIASNGLSIYEFDDQRVVDLYRQFHNGLKPGGVLVTSFLTPPLRPGVKTEWLVERVDLQDAMLQKIFFADVLSVKWQAYRSEELVRLQLAEAGFGEIEIFYDEAHIFPTVVAKKN